MKILITEYKRMFFEKKIIWFLIISVTYIITCVLFFNLRFILDYGYESTQRGISALYLWQYALYSEGYAYVLASIVPGLIYVFSFMDDRKYGFDGLICVKTRSDRYYTMKYIAAITGGMIYNFLTIVLTYIALHFFLATGDYSWNDLDRQNTLIGKYFAGNSAMEFVFTVAVGFAFLGGVQAAMSYVISIWLDNRVLVCMLPYFIMSFLGYLWKMSPFYHTVRGKRLDIILFLDVDCFMDDKSFNEHIYYFVWWILLISILFIISYTINIEKKK